MLEEKAINYSYILWKDNVADLLTKMKSGTQ